MTTVCHWKKRYTIAEGLRGLEDVSRIGSYLLSEQGWQSAVTYVYRGARATRQAAATSTPRRQRPRRFAHHNLTSIRGITERYACAAAGGRVATTP